jgi:hypothetical protein
VATTAAVAELLDRDDRVGEEGQLLAQAADVHVDGARAAGVLVAPHVGQQEIAREHAAAVLDQILEQQEFLRGEPDVFAIDRHGVTLDVDDERPVGEGAGGGRAGRPLHAAEQRANAGGELSRAERLGHVIIRAQFKAGNSLRFLRARGEHDDRNRRGRRIVAQRLADEQAVHPRQHQIEHHQIGSGILDSLQRRGTRGHGVDLVPGSL